ncbi:thiopurine S-methyltransferase-like [Acanthaster planci]|uniref:thiopurine S-methyltransferase n=1 Tax=Acanthaster planci TaxID=133434 RepID=A0A8B7YGA2_ACAPL|nr:thiopurine S-methyltransferase-like [Acanthaster planci]XP_022091599.1 thiopurine S-methyltransferase-like [Acanthaster planci]XP_022091609.1 thiopurine S-methyltransferase-like [Acanthaster planci]XP_022091617.1 thiopurine S-methyltransferase-like [Acanthaster planci]XP_022091626.1 thiopurine S-methyltransferase-like [Acanthaster planci]XP_022091632.1 thiopurine S-methyltransferase-like [Acanthaster planci]
MNTVAAPLENGFCNGNDEGVVSAKRIKLGPQQANESCKPTKPAAAAAVNANGHPTAKSTERRKSATACSSENFRVAENGHQDVNNEEKDHPTSSAALIRRNQDGEISDGYLTTDDWKTKWERGKTKFHKTQVHGMLKKHYQRLVQGRDAPRFLVPLCGKTLDMIWLLEQGCGVVGCDVVELGVQQFFVENKLEYTTETLKDIDGTVYKGKDEDITIYCADFFKLSSALIGQFDCIWDRGSMAAINPSDRKRYCDVISDVLKPDSRYLLDIFEVPHDVFSGPPHNIDPEEITQLFGDVCRVEQLEHVDAMNPWSKTWGVAYFYENNFLLTRKK